MRKDLLREYIEDRNKRSLKEDVNGYENEWTSIVVMWIAKDRGWYKFTKDLARDCDSAEEFADNLQEAFESIVEERNSDGLFEDILSAAIRQVRFDQIADHFWEDWGEDLDESLTESMKLPGPIVTILLNNQDSWAYVNSKQELSLALHKLLDGKSNSQEVKRFLFDVDRKTDLLSGLSFAFDSILKSQGLQSITPRAAEMRRRRGY